MIAYTVEDVPKWNPINICSYHLQEAGATPVQEIAYAMSNAIAVLDAVRDRVPQELMGDVFGRISFFVNAGVRFVEEHAKLRAMAQIWDGIGRVRYVVEGSKVMDGLVEELVEGAREEMQRVAELGGAVEAVDYMKAGLVESHRERWRRIEAGEQTVVGMNRFTTSETSPLTADADGGI